MFRREQLRDLDEELERQPKVDFTKHPAVSGPRILARPQPAPLAVNEMVASIKNITDQFGQRGIPDDIPEAYRNLIINVQDGLRAMASTFIDAAQEADGMIKDLIGRHERHQAYMKRESRIAEKLTEKYAAIRAEIKNELETEEALKLMQPKEPETKEPDPTT